MLINLSKIYRFNPIALLLIISIDGFGQEKITQFRGPLRNGYLS